MNEITKEVITPERLYEAMKPGEDMLKEYEWLVFLESVTKQEPALTGIAKTVFSTKLTETVMGDREPMINIAHHIITGVAIGIKLANKYIVDSTLEEVKTQSNDVV